MKISTLAQKISVILAGSLTCLGALTFSQCEVEAIVFTDRADWDAEFIGDDVFVEDFNSQPLGNFPVGTTDLGSIEVTIDGSNQFTRIANMGLIDDTNEFQGFIIQNSPTVGTLTSITFNFGIDVIGFGADFFSALTGDFLTVSTGANTYEFDNFLSFPGNGFLGVVEDTVFSAITFEVENLTNFGEWFTLDNLVFARRARPVSVPVPEPTSGLGMLAFGAASAIALLKRKGRSSQ